MFLRTLVVAARGPDRRQAVAALDQVESLVTTVDSSERMRQQLSRKPFDLVLLEKVGSVESSLRLVAEIRDRAEAPEVILLTDSDDAEDRATLVAGGSFAVVYTGLESESLQDSLRSLAERRLAEASARIQPVPDAEYRLGDYATQSPAMKEFLRLARRVASKDSTLLLLGETGVGKGLLARSIHNEGPRSGMPFVSVNCGAMTESLLESELFGHEKGAFTGADRTRRGHFEIAHQGTIFLDEVGEMPLHLQVKLLQVLEDRRLQPVGSEKTIDVDVRIIAATNRDLATEVEQKRFRSDLYYRLNVVGLTLPALRDRKEDIPEIAQSYVDHFRARIAGDVKGIASEAVETLVRYPWPGNMRELINAIERGVIMSIGEEIRVEDLPLEIQEMAPLILPDLEAGNVAAPEASWLAKSWAELRREVLEETELRYLLGLLRDTEGRVGEAAKRAGMDPRSLHQKMKKYGLRKEAFQ